MEEVIWELWWENWCELFCSRIIGRLKLRMMNGSSGRERSAKHCQDGKSEARQAPRYFRTWKVIEGKILLLFDAQILSRLRHVCLSNVKTRKQRKLPPGSAAVRYSTMGSPKSAKDRPDKRVHASGDLSMFWAKSCVPYLRYSSLWTRHPLKCKAPTISHVWFHTWTSDYP